jgi:membrane fusion protein, multidrug efflux system
MANPLKSKWVLIVVLVVAATGGYFLWQYLSQWESTDDAQVDGHINPVNARIGGTVVSIAVKENDHVKAGTVLVQLDPREFELAVSRAQAELAEAQAVVIAARANVPIASSTAGTQISSTVAAAARARANIEASNREVMAAQARVAVAEARVKEAQAAATKAARDLERMKMLIEKDEISQQQYDAAVTAAEAARAAVESAQAAASQVQHEVEAAKAHVAQADAELQQAQAEAEGAKTAPQQVIITKAQAQSAEARVQLAETALDQARLNLEYATIKAPVNGMVSKKTVEVGQVVQAGQPLMAVVPNQDVWITANFKETQLAEMHPGQAATVSVDAYSRSYTAHIDSISSATGAKFSLLPPENATGNYVKVVQRVPVKILLDEGQDPDHQLRPGMSVVAKVKVK